MTKPEAFPSRLEERHRRGGGGERRHGGRQIVELLLRFVLAAERVGDEEEVALPVHVVVAGIALLRRPLRMLELGEESARALGVRTGLTQTLLVILAVGLTGTATAVAGPIGFVALAAPQIARRAVRGAGIPMAASGAMGAVLLLLADVLAQRALAPCKFRSDWSPARSVGPISSGSSPARRPPVAERRH